MKLMESRLLAVEIDKAGREAVLSVIDTNGVQIALELHGVERLLINELREQNVIEEVMHWTRGQFTVELRDAAFALMTGVAEKDCGPH